MFLASEDAALLSTGVFVPRRGTQAAAFLEDVWGSDAGSPFDNHGWWEQAAAFYALTFGPRATQYAAGTLMVPQEAINPYPPETAAKSYDAQKRVLDSARRPGDLVMSFSGCRDRCNELFELCSDAAMRELREVWGKSSRR